MHSRFLHALLLAILFSLALPTIARTPRKVLVEVRCYATPRSPRVTLFTNGSAQMITSVAETARVSPEALLFLKAMCADRGREPSQWFSALPDQNLREVVVTVPAITRSLIPAYVLRRGAPPANRARLHPTPRLEELVIAVLEAVGCPEMVELCR